jgi:hypothetical protein
MLETINKKEYFWTGCVYILVDEDDEQIPVMFAQIDAFKFAFIDLRTGNRYLDGFKCGNSVAEKDEIFGKLGIHYDDIMKEITRNFSKNKEFVMKGDKIPYITKGHYFGEPNFKEESRMEKIKWPSTFLTSG